MQEAVERGAHLILHPDLCDHISPGNVRIPSRTAIYDARVTFDMATMLYSRQFIITAPKDCKGEGRMHFDTSASYALHLRTDASPQFGRDYQVTQCDIVRQDLSCENPSWETVQITKRLLPTQNVGSRASTAAHKLRKVIFSLGLESRDVNYSAAQTCSLMVDSGTESALWLTPLLAEDASECSSFFFANCMPLPDSDHLLHHVMNTLTEQFNWESFQPKLNTLSRYFSLRTRCDRFISVCIRKNNAVVGQKLKDSFAILFAKTCPTLVATRWGYLFETLHWLMPRREALTFLISDPVQGNDQEFRDDERKLLLEVTQPGRASTSFWAVCA